MSEPTSRRRRSEMRAETRAALLAAARRSFAEVGYAATAMDALCEEAGFTRGALYHHFGGKEGLLDAVVVEMDAEIGAHMDAAWHGADDPLDAFRACYRTYLTFALEPDFQRIVFRDAPSVLGQRLREIDEASSIAPLIELLDELMDGGRIRRLPTEALARLLNGAMIDAALWIAAHAEPEAAREQALHALDALVEGLCIA